MMQPIVKKNYLTVWGLSFFYSVWTYEIVLRRICLLQLYMYALDFFYFFFINLKHTF